MPTETQKQIASVMLQHGTKEQQKEALAFCGLAEATGTPRPLVSTGASCCLAKPGLTEKESEEWEDFLKMRISDVSQEDWQRFHELNDKYLSALVEECKRIEAR